MEAFTLGRNYFFKLKWICRNLCSVSPGVWGWGNSKLGQVGKSLQGQSVPFTPATNRGIGMSHLAQLEISHSGRKRSDNGWWLPDKTHWWEFVTKSAHQSSNSWLYPSRLKIRLGLNVWPSPICSTAFPSCNHLARKLLISIDVAIALSDWIQPHPSLGKWNPRQFDRFV